MKGVTREFMPEQKQAFLEQLVITLFIQHATKNGVEEIMPTIQESLIKWFI